MTLRRRFALLASLAVLAALVPSAALAVPGGGSTVFVNELHYDNAGADAGEAIEVAGPAGTDLTGWDLVLYNGSGGASYNTTALPAGPLGDDSGGYGFAVVSYPSNGIQNGSPDGVALVDDAGQVVQFLSYEGSFTATDGPASGLTSTDIGVAEAGTEPAGQSLQLSGSGDSYGDFTWQPPATSTFDAQNNGQTFSGGGDEEGDQPPTITCPPPISTVEGEAETATVTARDETGTVTSIVVESTTPPTDDIRIESSDAPSEPGETATATLLVESDIEGGTYDVSVLATTEDGEEARCTVRVTVRSILTIGAVQGSVPDSANGATFTSPRVGQTVVVRGVVTQRTLQGTSSGGQNHGFFLQNLVAGEPSMGGRDGDPNSSDGIFVFQGGNPAFAGGYEPQPGDEIVLQGRVSEFFNLTQLSSSDVLRVVRDGVPVTDDALVETIDVDPPDDLADSNRYFERVEGMRGRIPQGSVVVDSRDVFGSSADAEVWVIRGDHPVAQRSDPYARRVHRDFHPLDNNPDQRFDDGNGYRINLGSIGLKAERPGRPADSRRLIAPARVYDELTAPTVGALYFSFGKYTWMIEEDLLLEQGVDPAGNAPPTAPDRASEFSSADYNVENLYDFRDDPFDGCDFSGNSGCSGVRPPFDYVPASDAEYQQRLGEIAQQIRQDLFSPDFLAVQEAEDQDICTADVAAQTFSCGSTDNADGKPDTLQELAVRIAQQTDGAVQYDAVYDRDGSDDRGIVSAIMFRTDRVELAEPAEDDPVLGSSPEVNTTYRGTPLPYTTEVSNPKALNADLPEDVDRGTGIDGEDVFTRDPQVGLFRVFREAVGSGPSFDLYVISNHFSSGVSSRVGQRTEQANYNALLAESIGLDRLLVIAGDFNVYPRPDDPYAPGEPYRTDQTGPSDQLAALYEADLVNLYDRLLDEVPVAAFSYIFQGQTQTLDSQFVSPALDDRYVQVRVPHVNADYPADFPGDGPRGLSDHDPSLARFSLPDDLTADTEAPASPTIDDPAPITRDNQSSYQVSGTSEPGSTVAVVLRDSADASATGTATAGTDGRYLVRVDASDLADGVIDISVTATDAAGNVSAPATESTTKSTSQRPPGPDDGGEDDGGEDDGGEDDGGEDDDGPDDGDDDGPDDGDDDGPDDGDDGGDDDGPTEGATPDVSRIGSPEGRTQTALEVSRAGFGEDGADAVVLSRPDIFPDALAGTPLAIQERGPLLLTASEGLEPAVATELRRVLPDGATVFLLGGANALSEQVASDVGALGFSVVRLGGANRFATAAIIADAGLDNPSTLLLADGEAFPDAVAAGAAAGAIGGAVILTGAAPLPPETQAYLDANPVARFAVGAPAAEVVPDATPVFGATRIETAVGVAQTFFDNPSVVGVATGEDFPDALAGGAFIGARGGPLLLSGQTLEPAVAVYLSSEAASIDRAFLFGGPARLPEAVADAVEAAIDG